MDLPTSQTPQLILIDIFLVLMIYLTLRRCTVKPYKTGGLQYFFAVTLILIFCLFSFWGSDWFHYIGAFYKLKSGKNSHIEDVYYWIASISPGYLFFRFYIWGSAIFLLIEIFRRISVSKELSLIIFSCLYLTWFSYARASLAMVMAYYAYLLYLKPYRNKQLSYFLAIAALLASFYLHKSGLFAIASVLVCMCIKRYPAKSVIFILASYPLLILIVKYQLSDIMASEISGNENDMSSYLSRGQRYLEAKEKVRGLGSLLVASFESIPYYIASAISFFELKNRRSIIPQDIKAFMLLLIVLLVFSTIFLFDLGFNTSMFYVRFIKFLAIPSSIVLAYLYQNRIYPRLTKASLLIGVLGTAYTLLYTFYCSIVGG